MIALVEDFLVALLVAGLVAVAVMAVLAVTRLVAYVRLHRPLANKRFMARYRAANPRSAGPPWRRLTPERFRWSGPAHRTGMGRARWLVSGVANAD